MPVLPTPNYLPAWLFRNRHVHTIYPAVFRRIRDVVYQRERITLPDTDFLDLDWSRCASGVDNPEEERLSIVLHGLEGSAAGGYVRGMVRAMNRAGWDAVAVNFRGCSGEPNRLLRSYHAGATEDLAAVLEHITATYAYREIMLVGFSLGGNLTLKYLGDVGTSLPAQVVAAAGVSVPCDLAASVEAMSTRTNQFYIARFMRNLREKMREKAASFPGQLSIDGLDEMTTFYEFDDHYTAPLHGYGTAANYWRVCSCRTVLPNIRIPTLILNAADDPFLGPACFPVREAEQSTFVYLEMPAYGGHVGFIDRAKDKRYWSEQRVVSFFQQQLG